MNNRSQAWCLVREGVGVLINSCTEMKQTHRTDTELGTDTQQTPDNQICPLLIRPDPFKSIIGSVVAGQLAMATSVITITMSSGHEA